MKQKFHDIIFGYDTPAGRRFDIVLLWLILASVIMVMLESVPSIRAEHRAQLKWLEWVFTGIFTVEYLLRVWSANDRKRYITSFMGVVDLLSILPSYLGLFLGGTQSLMVLRSIRLVRVFRILNLSQFIGGANEIRLGILRSRHRIIVFLGFVLCLVMVLGTILYLVEGPEHGFDSIPRSIYWAIVTLTTVGYGDIAPQTVAGQTIAALVMILGYSLIAVPTGIVSSEMMSVKKDEQGVSCPKCGKTTHAPAARYCNECGTPLELG